MRKLIVISALALLVPSLALAGGNPGKGKSNDPHGKAAPKVMYVLRGTLTAYTAASEQTNGTVSILVKSANHHGASLKNQILTFAVTPATKVVHTSTWANTDTGMVKVRGPKRLAPTDTLSTVLQALPAFQVIDQHHAK